MTCNADIPSVLEWIETHQDYDFDVEAVVSASGYSRWHLMREFQKQTGQTLGHYLISRRLNHAKRLIDDNELHPLDISLICGYSNEVALSRAFAIKFGITVAKYIKQKRKENEK